MPADHAADLARFLQLAAVSTSVGEYLSKLVDIQPWLDAGLVIVTGSHRCGGWVYWLPA